MVKSITKIRPYRVFKKDGLHFVKINKKKVYIRHGTKNKLRNGDKQIVNVVVNNLLAQRKSRQRKRKNKPVLAIESASAEQPASGQSNGKVDITKIPDSAGPQAPSTDPLYANANKRTQPQQIEGRQKDNGFSIADIQSGLMNAYLLGKENMAFGNQVIYGKKGGDNIKYGEGFDISDPDDKLQISSPPDILDISNQDDKSQISEAPDLVDLSHIPDEGSPPDGAAAAPEPDLLIEEATAEEQQNRQAAIDAEIEANRSPEEKKQIEAEKQQLQIDEQTLLARQAEEQEKETSKIDEDEKTQAEEKASTRGTPIGQELNSTNIQLHIIQWTKKKHTNFSASDLREKILELEPDTDLKTLDTFQDGLRQKYVTLLLKHPNRIPYYIEPRPDIRLLKEKLFNMTAILVRSDILPKVMKPGKPYNKLAGSSKDILVQTVWDLIYADPELQNDIGIFFMSKGMQKTGKGLTNDTIKQEGMTSDEIAQVLKKKTHHVIPVIASDQIATLLPLVNNKTQQFGFVINSQSLKKPGMHWKAIYFDRKRAEVCYFDSLVSEPTEAVMRGIKQIMHKMADPLYFKFKINRIKFQANDSSTCGAFALRFIDDMYADKPFKVATRFTDEHIEGEKSIRKYISKWGYV